MGGPMIICLPNCGGLPSYLPNLGGYLTGGYLPNVGDTYLIFGGYLPNRGSTYQIEGCTKIL